jgi:hypothetical protein
VIAELVRHSVAEEEYMYPAARKTLEGGDQLADHELEEHAKAEKLMKELDGLDAWTWARPHAGRSHGS